MVKKRNRGRPRLGENQRKMAVFRMRLTRAERKAWEEASGKKGMTLSEWFRKLAHDAVDERRSI